MWVRAKVLFRKNVLEFAHGKTHGQDNAEQDSFVRGVVSRDGAIGNFCPSWRSSGRGRQSAHSFLSVCFRGDIGPRYRIGS
jgi:hypothetical protein